LQEINFACLPKRRLGIYRFASYWVFLEILFEKFSKAGDLVLDAGCGKGGFLKKLREDTYGVGLDIERENIEEAKKGKGLKNLFFVIGDLEYLPFRMETFNIVFCRNVLEHIKNGEKGINEMTFVLKNNGVILISTSNLLSPAMLLDTLLPKNVSAKIIKKLGGPEYYERIFRFFPFKLVKKLRENGLQVKVVMFGYPQMGKPWIYRNNACTKLPMVYYPWIIFDRMTNLALFRNFKLMMIYKHINLQILMFL